MVFIWITQSFLEKILRKIELKPATIEDTQEYYKEHKGEFVEFFKVRVWRSMSWIKKQHRLPLMMIWILNLSLYG